MQQVKMITKRRERGSNLVSKNRRIKCDSDNFPWRDHISLEWWVMHRRSVDDLKRTQMLELDWTIRREIEAQMLIQTVGSVRESNVNVVGVVGATEVCSLTDSLWVFMCLVRLDETGNARSHRGHLNGFSPECTRIWVDRLAVCEKDFAHISHL